MTPPRTLATIAGLHLAIAWTCLKLALALTWWVVFALAYSLWERIRK